MEKRPSYDGSGLVNLIAELELRMTGEAPSPGLEDSSMMPDAATFVLVLFDGLGVAQMAHEGAASFRATSAGALDAPFPTTTSVSLACVASGLAPSQHGQVSHLTWFPDLDRVVNTLKWVTVDGQPVPYDYGRLLPRPNLWERLRSAGYEPITVQPDEFRGSPLSRALYRGARFEGAWDAQDLVDATVSLAAAPGRFIFTYVPFVDVAGHLHGQGSAEFAEAMARAAYAWDGIVSNLPPGAAVVGTADHGLMEVSETDKSLVREAHFEALRFAGDPRGVHLWGDPSLIDDLAKTVRGELVDPGTLLGPDPTATALSRIGEMALLASPGQVILPRGFDKRLRCYHGGLTAEEVDIPLLLG